MIHMKKKMQKLFWVIISLLTAGFLVSGCALKKAVRYDAQYFDLFDTVTVFTAYESSQQAFDGYSRMMYEEMETYHRLYDIYHDYEGIHNIKTINDNAGIRPVEVDEKIISLLEEAVRMYEETDGKVNVAMGSVLSLWHDCREEAARNPENARIPSREELQAAAKHMDIHDVVIDREASTVYLKDGEMSLDVGAVAKGYAVEMTCRKLEEAGLKSALLNVGGNVRAIGRKPDGAGWAVGIQNPDLNSSQAYLHSVSLQDMALVTSGTYQRFFEADGVRYHHIINPDILAPWQEYESVTILCPDSGLADALSTAVFNMEAEEGAAFIEGMDGVEAMWIYGDGRENYSSGFRRYMDS